MSLPNPQIAIDANSLAARIEKVRGMDIFLADQ